MARFWESQHMCGGMGIFWSHICALHVLPSVLPCCGSHTVEDQGRWWEVMGGGMSVPHVVSFHSDKLCSADMPPALNKPVAAPRAGPLKHRVVGRRVRRDFIMEQKDSERRLVVLVAHCVLPHIFQSLYSVDFLVPLDIMGLLPNCLHLLSLLGLCSDVCCRKKKLQGAKC